MPRFPCGCCQSKLKPQPCVPGTLHAGHLPREPHLLRFPLILSHTTIWGLSFEHVTLGGGQDQNYSISPGDMSGRPNSAGFTDVRGSGNKTWGSRQPIKATKKSRDSRLQVPTCQWMLFLLLKSSAGPQEGSSTVLRQPSGSNSVTGFQCAACGEQMAPRLRQLQMCPPSWVSESSFTQSCALTAFPSSRL